MSYFDWFVLISLTLGGATVVVLDYMKVRAKIRRNREARARMAQQRKERSDGLG